MSAPRHTGAAACVPEYRADDAVVMLAQLRDAADELSGLEAAAFPLRRKRDRLALTLIDLGVSWRDVADAADFENPYIAKLQRDRAAGKGAWDEPVQP